MNKLLLIIIIIKETGNDCVALATKLKNFFNASCHGVSVCKKVLSLSELYLTYAQFCIQ